MLYNANLHVNDNIVFLADDVEYCGNNWQEVIRDIKQRLRHKNHHPCFLENVAFVALPIFVFIRNHSAISVMLKLHVHCDVAYLPAQAHSKVYFAIHQSTALLRLRLAVDVRFLAEVKRHTYGNQALY